MRKFLAAAHQRINVVMKVPVVFVIGDQQTFSRIVWLKKMEPENYKSLVPFMGDFHAACHMLMAIHILWWGPLVKFLVEKSNVCVDSTREKWDSVELYNRYRHLYETLIVAVLKYLLEVVPEHMLDHPLQLLHVASQQNKGPPACLLASLPACLPAIAAN